MTDKIPFSAAIFDLDGTVLDSMGVWRDVDRRFFDARGITQAEDYFRCIAGMSFRETAEYTVKRFQLTESVDEVVRIWLEMSADEYAHHVTLKPGARDYLRMLKRAGVKLAVATANKAPLFRPAMEHNGIWELFDAVCSTDEVGDKGKAEGEVFLLAARKLGVDPADCAVFEDTLEGVQGAHRVGMRAYGMLDQHSAHNFNNIIACADGAIEDFGEMRKYHFFPENARRCVIFSAYCECEARAAYDPKPNDYILCADGGWKLAARLGLRPDAVLGDFDSSEAPEGGEIRRFPVEKDDTDTMLCLKQGLSMGIDEFLIVGGFGGRVDHTLANFQTLNYAASRFACAQMFDGDNWATVVRNGSAEIPARAGKLSVFALDAECKGVTIRGAKYGVTDATLTNAFPLGVSNEFQGKTANVSVKDGALLVTICGDK